MVQSIRKAVVANLEEIFFSRKKRYKFYKEPIDWTYKYNRNQQRKDEELIVSGKKNETNRAGNAKGGSANSRNCETGDEIFPGNEVIDKVSNEK